jgi:ribosomal protein S18 acetylase RimI-like enzyme
MHPLDNPVWSSLTTLHSGLALACDGVLRYPSDVAPFVAVAEAGMVPAPALDAFVGTETVFMLGPKPALPSGWIREDLGVILQMVCEAPLVMPEGPPIVELGTTHRGAVLELAALVYPHYFRPRTMDLGRYHGVVVDGRLEAMIGERMGMPRLREISAVCTHPEHVGRGLARRLLAHATNDLLERGETPFLHVSPANERAVELYQRNGYRRRIDMPFWSLRRAT